MTGRSVMARTASTARRSSWRSEKVSTTKASTPPSSSPSACSRKAALASSGVIDPSGARYFPRGPMEPSTKMSRPSVSRTSRASLTPRRVRGSGAQAQRHEHLGSHLVGIESRGVHLQVGLRIVRYAGFVERLDLVTRLPVKHWAITNSERSLEKRGELAREPHDRAECL